MIQMKHLITKTAFILFLTLATLQLSAQNVAGTYRSNFAVAGFFTTTVKLNPDGTFERWLVGDMQRQRLQGKYTQKDGKLYLQIVAKKDAPVDLSATNVHSYALKKSGDINYHLLYYIGKNRLYAHNDKTGKRVIKEKNYAKNRKQKYYLKKVK
jgi:hypothetical protein